MLLAGGCGGDGTSQETFPLCADDPGPAPLRRITRFEYGRTLADLTGVDRVGRRRRCRPTRRRWASTTSPTRTACRACTRPRYLDVAEQAAATLIGGRRAADARSPAAIRRPATPPASSAFIARLRAARLAAAARPTTSSRRCGSSTPTPPIRAATDGLTAVVAAMLQAPQFLYRPEPASRRRRDAARRLRAGDAARRSC